MPSQLKGVKVEMVMIVIMCHKRNSCSTSKGHPLYTLSLPLRQAFRIYQLMKQNIPMFSYGHFYGL